MTTKETQMDFSQALKEAKAGQRISRAGWNGKGMFVACQPGYPDGVPLNANGARAFHLAHGTVCKFGPYLAIRGADGVFLPWAPSQQDLLAEDWNTVEGAPSEDEGNPKLEITLKIDFGSGDEDAIYVSSARDFANMIRKATGATRPPDGAPPAAAAATS